MDKTSAHIERLADVVEIIIGAVREEPWFRCVTAHYRPLPAFFNLLVALCRLVQHLDARLHSGYLKHKREVLPMLVELAVSTRIAPFWFDPSLCTERLTPDCG